MLFNCNNCCTNAPQFTHTICLVNRTVQFLNADDRTLPRSPPCCHIPRACQFTIRLSFYYVQYGICGADIPQNTRGQSHFEPAKYGLLQTEKTVRLPVFTAGLPQELPPQTQDFMQCLIISGILN